MNRLNCYSINKQNEFPILTRTTSLVDEILVVDWLLWLLQITDRDLWKRQPTDNLLTVFDDVAYNFKFFLSARLRARLIFLIFFITFLTYYFITFNILQHSIVDV